jgi:hypothetical protein
MRSASASPSTSPSGSASPSPITLRRSRSAGATWAMAENLSGREDLKRVPLGLEVGFAYVAEVFAVDLKR